MSNSRLLPRIVPIVFMLLVLARTTSGGAVEPPPADVAPPGGWKLDDFRDAMRNLRGRSYENGKRLFVKANCTACHRQDQVGNEFGPDLTRLDERFQPLDILRDVLEPSRRIADEKFDLWVFETEAGRTISGLIARQTVAHVEVLEKPAVLAPAVVLDKRQIVERKMSLTSIMPQGLLNVLTRDEIADLIAYVAARGTPAE